MCACVVVVVSPFSFNGLAALRGALFPVNNRLTGFPGGSCSGDCKALGSSFPVSQAGNSAAPSIRTFKTKQNKTKRGV